MTDGPITFTGLIKFLQYIKGPDSWHIVGATGEPVFETSWVAFGDPRQAPRFMKDVSGVVHIQGTTKDGTIGTDAVFTLPAGYRPPKTLTFATDSNDAFGRVVVGAAGLVKATHGNNTSVSLNCSFYVG